MKTFLALLPFLLFSWSAPAADWYVATNGAGQGTNGWPDATNSLQGAITACPSNGTVWVSNGIYVGTLAVGTGIIVRSRSGNPDSVLLDGNAAGTVVSMSGLGGRIIGCTISNGYNMNQGGGAGDGIVSNCIVKNNSADTGGGAAGCSVYNSLIINNSAYAGLGGGGVYCIFYNCTVSANTSAQGGGGGEDCTFINSISWGNDKPDVFDMAYSNYYSCGVGYTNTGSISVDPLFVGGGDYSLQYDSPCRNAGNNSAWSLSELDLAGNRRLVQGTVDMGAYENQTPWSITIQSASPGNIGATGIGNVRSYAR